jgi:hypothetical protein
MIRSVLIAFFLVALAISCRGSEQETFALKNAVISTGQKELPESYPAFTRYPGSQILISGIYTDTSLFEDPEGAAVLKTADDSERVGRYYATSFEKSGWNVIQSHRQGEEILIMAESPFRRLVTVVLRGSGPTLIRLYTKRPGGN